MISNGFNSDQSLFELQMIDIKWKPGHTCPHQPIGTYFDGPHGYDLNYAKDQCSLLCDENAFDYDCNFAVLHYQEELQTCYVMKECGDWQSNTNSDYYVYIKGI